MMTKGSSLLWQPQGPSLLWGSFISSSTSTLIFHFVFHIYISWLQKSALFTILVWRSPSAAGLILAARAPPVSLASLEQSVSTACVNRYWWWLKWIRVRLKAFLNLVPLCAFLIVSQEKNIFPPSLCCWVASYKDTTLMMCLLLWNQSEKNRIKTLDSNP